MQNDNNKEIYKHKRSKSYASQRDSSSKQSEMNKNTNAVKRSIQQQNMIIINNNNFSNSSKTSMTDIQNRKRGIISSIGYTESMETQASTIGNTLAMQSAADATSQQYLSQYKNELINNSQLGFQRDMSLRYIQKSMPVNNNFSTLPDQVYQSVENVYPQFKQKVILKRNKEKTEYERNKEEVIGRYCSELYKNDKYLYRSQQQLIQIEGKQQLELFKKEIEIQQKALHAKEQEKQNELSNKKYPNIWKMVRHYQETKVQDVADLLKMKEFSDEKKENQNDQSISSKNIDRIKIQKNQGYASATISSTNFVKNQLKQAKKQSIHNNQQNEEKNNKKQQPIQSFLEKECKKAKQMAEELEIQQMMRNGVNCNQDNAGQFNDANKINQKIKKYCKLIRPTGASLSNKVEQKFVDNNMKYFLISSTIEMDQTEKIALKQEFEKNKIYTNNFGNSIKKTQQSKVMEEFVRDNQKEKNEDYLNDNVILFPTEIDQILQTSEFTQKQNNFTQSEQFQTSRQNDSRFNTQEGDCIQEEDDQIYENLSKSSSPKSSRRVSIPKIINGRITLEVKQFIKKNLPQTKHYVHFRSRRDKRSSSAIGYTNSRRNQLNDEFNQDQNMNNLQSSFMLKGGDSRYYQGSSQQSMYLESNQSQQLNTQNTRYDQQNTRQDQQYSQQLNSKTMNSTRGQSAHDTRQQFVLDSQAKINHILSSCSQIKSENYQNNNEDSINFYQKKRTAKDVIIAMEKLRDNKTQKIKDRLMNESELIEKNDIKQLAEGQKVLSYLEQQIDQSNWDKRIQDKEHEHKKDLLRQQQQQIKGNNLVKVSQITTLHKKKMERNKIQQKCYIQSQEKQLSKYINLADFVGFK